MAYYDYENYRVKFEDTLKCLKISDLCRMDDLRMEICDLFNIPSVADFTLTYADNDGDVITICDDIDVEKAMIRGRINVQLSNNKGVAEGLQSVPQQICEALKLYEALLKISEDIVSKAITGPVLVELADFISKMTQSYLNLDSQSTQSRADSTTQNKKKKKKNKKTTQNVADVAKL
ncbi:protein JOKA2-like isoform X2 [Juglans microcarpa x Juglans regia]|uniref:protein JOKA2-like isoform X2 n=1 Tax=Juglans microcarpa x Juglans regia TaxID=2249226 RepID=UPI001B7DFEF4|nr:protein JOKA2-like isoform X2 [Juglans microcarpa x Juglans regia]